MLATNPKIAKNNEIVIFRDGIFYLEIFDTNNTD